MVFSTIRSLSTITSSRRSRSRERVGELASGWRRRGYELDLGAGIAVGHATLGRIGFEGRYDYGVLGTVTNLAARLSDEASPGQILLSQRAYAAVEARVAANRVDDLLMKGFSKRVAAYEVLGVVDERDERERRDSNGPID
jgi:adenylate cyclase